MDDDRQIDQAVRREMLSVALRNAVRSVVMLMAGAGYVAWLGFEQGKPLVGGVVFVLAVVVATWRVGLWRRHRRTSAMGAEALGRVIRQLEVNSVLVGVMWVVATVAVYPALAGITATIYVVMVCGSISIAAFFMSMAGRSFAILTVMQLGAIVGVSLFDPLARSDALALLAVGFGVTMAVTTRELRDVSWRAVRHGLEAVRANESLRQAKEAAEAANLAKSQFLATMSHEIRTPMNGVLGALDLLRRTPLEARQKCLVKTAAASGGSLMDLLDDVLDHSKIEAGKLVPAAEPMSLHAVAAAAVVLFRANAENRGLSVALDIAAGVPDGVVGDAPRLKQVLLNLIGNGLKFTEKGGVALRLAATSGAAPGRCRVRFEVRDSGIGIPAEALGAVFQPFHQVQGAGVRLRGGTGLGLAICQRIVEAMGGCIEVASRVGRGSSFWFELEFAPAADLPDAACDSDFGELADDDRLQGVVLLVEDNLVNRMIGVEMLRSFGLEVLEAEDGAEGVRALERRCVDLVLMDVQMPVLDGYGATRRVREREARLRLPRVPIVALTAYAFEEDAAQSLAAGMDAQLTKPYTREQLGEVLRRWLLSAPRAAATEPSGAIG